MDLEELILLCFLCFSRHRGSLLSAGSREKMYSEKCLAAVQRSTLCEGASHKSLESDLPPFMAECVPGSQGYLVEAQMASQASADRSQSFWVSNGCIRGNSPTTLVVAVLLLPCFLTPVSSFIPLVNDFSFHESHTWFLQPDPYLVPKSKENTALSGLTMFSATFF